MSLSNIIRYLLWLLPISSLSLAAQALYAWLYPFEEISQKFFSTLSDFYLLELLFMHSSIFWIGRNYMLNGNLKKKNISTPPHASILKQGLFAVFLFVAYGMFIFPLYPKNSFLVWNYVALNIMRMIDTERAPWYTNTSFYKKHLHADLIPFLTFGSAMAKVFIFGLFLPLLVDWLPLPDFGLTAELAKNFPSNDSNPYGLILLTKSLFFYFGLMALLDSIQYLARLGKIGCGGRI